MGKRYGFRLLDIGGQIIVNGGDLGVRGTMIIVAVPR